MKASTCSAITEPATFCMLVSTMPRSANAGIATQRSTPAYMRCTQRMRGPASITSGDAFADQRVGIRSLAHGACAVRRGDERDAGRRGLHPAELRRVGAHQHDLLRRRPARTGRAARSRIRCRPSSSMRRALSASSVARAGSDDEQAQETGGERRRAGRMFSCTNDTAGRPPSAYNARRGSVARGESRCAFFPCSCRRSAGSSRSSTSTPRSSSRARRPSSRCSRTTPTKAGATSTSSRSTRSSTTRTRSRTRPSR